jgi:HlyD family secretion protein
MHGGVVLTVADGERLVEKNVEPGIKNWDFVEIRSGLAAGERVVVSLDRPEVKAGVRVHVEEAGKS